VTYLLSWSLKIALITILVFFIFCPEKVFLSFSKCFVPKRWAKPLCVLRLFVTTTVTTVTDSHALLSVCSHYFNLLTTWTVVWKTAEVSTSGAVNLNPPPSYSFVSYCPPFPLPLPLRWTTYPSTGCIKNCNVKHEKHEDLYKEWSRPKQEMLIFILILVFLNLVLTLNIPSLARQRCLPSWGPRRTPWFFLLFLNCLMR